MNIEALAASMPDTLRPWVEKYGPVLLEMTAEEIRDWIERIAQRDVDGAYEEMIAKLPNQELLERFTMLKAEWGAANVKNAEMIQVQREAAAAAVRIILTIALAVLLA